MRLPCRNLSEQLNIVGLLTVGDVIYYIGAAEVSASQTHSARMSSRLAYS